MADFTYRRYNSPHRQGELWGVYLGKTVLESICRSEEEAKIRTANLNSDPWYYDRLAWNEFKKARSLV